MHLYLDVARGRRGGGGPSRGGVAGTQPFCSSPWPLCPGRPLLVACGGPACAPAVTPPSCILRSSCGLSATGAGGGGREAAGKGPSKARGAAWRAPRRCPCAGPAGPLAPFPERPAPPSYFLIVLASQGLWLQLAQHGGRCVPLAAPPPLGSRRRAPAHTGESPSPAKPMCTSCCGSPGEWRVESI